MWPLAQLVHLLAPAHQERMRRSYFLHMAFPGQREYHRVATDLQERAEVYVQQLLVYLHDEAPRLPDGQHPLMAYLATVGEELGHADQEALEALVAQLREALRSPDALRARDEAIAAYLARLTRAFEREMREVYVPLAGEATEQLAHYAPEPLAESDWFTDVQHWRRQPAPLQGDYHARDEAEAEAVADVAARLLTVRRAVLLGEPGSGKSWTLAQLAVRHADRWHAAEPEARAALPLPVIVPLNRFAGVQEGEPLAFADFVRARQGELAAESALAGRWLYLCDALNEMARQSADGRDLVGEVRAFLADKPHFVVSCRVRDYRDDLGLLRQHAPLEQVLLRELEPPQIRAVACRRLGEEQGEALWSRLGGSQALLAWWQRVSDQEEEAYFWDPTHKWLPEFQYANLEANNAWQAMHGRLMALCRNPFMLGVACEIFAEQGALPGSRATLFGEFVQTLLDREQEQATKRGELWVGHDAVELALVMVATAMQAAQGTVLTGAVAAESIGDGGVRLLDAAIAANVLREEGEGLRFSHQLLQEYFAARTLLQAMERGADPEEFFRGAWWAGVWHETAVILGELASLSEGARGANRVALWLAAASPEVALNVILRHGEGLSLADVEPTTRDALVASARSKVWESNPLGRAVAYRVLGTFDSDKRPGVGLRADGLPDIMWVKVEGGRFWIGGDEDAYRSLPLHQVEVPTFWMAQYPVTNAQWKTFLNDPHGYRNPVWWVQLAEGNQELAEPRWTYENHPREQVNWYEAMAFCRWLSHNLGYKVRLPTDIEWERAVRGTEGRYFTWGYEKDETKANIIESRIGQTSAVGIYLQGATPEGICDLIGNVAEWTLSTRDGYLLRRGFTRVLQDFFNLLGSHDQMLAGVEITSAEARVVRGGSWKESIHIARAAYRNLSFPNLRSDAVGFRLVSLAPLLQF